MLKGISTITVEHETLRIALQRYFQEVTFREAACPKVEEIIGVSSASFIVHLSEPNSAALPKT